MKKFLPIVLGFAATGGLVIGLAMVARGQGRRGGRGGDGFFRGGDRSFFDSEPNAPIGRALPQVIEAPADDPITPVKVALGRLLFWDPILSGDNDVAARHATIRSMDTQTAGTFPSASMAWDSAAN